jgi:hypothetical protein
MTTFIFHVLHSLHQNMYLQVILFLLAMLMLYVGIHSSKNQARYMSYMIAVLLVVATVYIA